MLQKFERILECMNDNVLFSGHIVLQAMKHELLVKRKVKRYHETGHVRGQLGENRSSNRHPFDALSRLTQSELILEFLAIAFA
jgi:hypothetical protein